MTARYNIHRRNLHYPWAIWCEQCHIYVDFAVTHPVAIKIMDAHQATRHRRSS